MRSNRGISKFSVSYFNRSCVIRVEATTGGGVVGALTRCKEQVCSACFLSGCSSRSSNRAGFPKLEKTQGQYH